jgi:hypothetical protein
MSESTRSEFKEFLNFMKFLILAIFFVVGMMFLSESISGIRDYFANFWTPSQKFESKVSAVGLSEAGDLVALVATNSAVEFWEQSSTWTYEGKEIIACCDYDLEYRYDLTKARVDVIDPDEKMIRITLPPVKVTCAVKDLRVLKAEGGQSVIGRYRIRESQINKVLDRAKESAMKAAGGSETNIRMAERSVRSTLATLFLPLVGSRSNIEFFFEEPSTGREAVAYDDERLQQSIKEGPAEEDKTK